MMNVYPLIIAGEKLFKKNTKKIYNKYNGSVFAEISVTEKGDADKAVMLAKKAFDEIYFDVQTRYQVLSKAAQLMIEKKAELVQILISETGKTVIDANNEVDWTVDLFVESAEEAKRIHGKTFCLPVPWLDTRTGYTRREPIGIVAAITPFNFPLNLVVHKIAPALAAGNPIILKPAESTSIIGYKICEILLEAGTPPEFISCLTGPGKEIGSYLTSNQDIAFYSFTGSVTVGKMIKKQIGLRKCALELGSNSATIICKDFDISKAATACVNDAFNNAGQVCISMQRIYVQNEIYEEFLTSLIDMTKEKTVGDPSVSTTEIGPMISENEAVRVMEWIAEAEQDGAIIHCGNKRDKSLVWPTILSNVNREMKVIKDEVFGPVVSVIPFNTMEQAYAMVNDSRYGLNSGILTNNMPIAMEAIAKLKTGSVIVGGTCGFRFGCMPYGGVKESGIGKEGPKYAMEEMMELKTVVILS